MGGDGTLFVAEVRGCEAVQLIRGESAHVAPCGSLFVASTLHLPFVVGFRKQSGKGQRVAGGGGRHPFGGRIFACNSVLNRVAVGNAVPAEVGRSAGDVFSSEGNRSRTSHIRGEGAAAPCGRSLFARAIALDGPLVGGFRIESADGQAVAFNQLRNPFAGRNFITVKTEIIDKEIVGIFIYVMEGNIADLTSVCA